MKRKLFCAFAVLFCLDGLYAFNPFKAMGNVLRGQAGCQPSLVERVKKGLFEYEKTKGRTLSGPALKKRQAFEKDMADLRGCIGNTADRSQQTLMGRKLRVNHPKLTESMASACQDPRFRSVFPNQCAIAGNAKDQVNRKKAAVNPDDSGADDMQGLSPDSSVGYANQQGDYQHEPSAPPAPCATQHPYGGGYGQQPYYPPQQPMMPMPSVDPYYGQQQPQYYPPYGGGMMGGGYQQPPQPMMMPQQGMPMMSPQYAYPPQPMYQYPQCGGGYGY